MAEITQPRAESHSGSFHKTCADPDLWHGDNLEDPCLENNEQTADSQRPFQTTNRCSPSRPSLPCTCDTTVVTAGARAPQRERDRLGLFLSWLVQVPNVRNPDKCVSTCWLGVCVCEHRQLEVSFPAACVPGGAHTQLCSKTQTWALVGGHRPDPKW